MTDQPASASHHRAETSTMLPASELIRSKAQPQHGRLRPIEDRGPLRVLFAITSMPVGGAERLLTELLRLMNRDRFTPELCCLKEPGELGESLTVEVPVHARLTTGKFDPRVLGRLRRLLSSRRIDAVITVGAGDKMFWGRLAAWLESVPVVVSALHSTGWPDGVGRLNRLLTPITDAFIAVADTHRDYLIGPGRFPADRVRVIPNGVDIRRFKPLPTRSAAIRQELGIPIGVPVCGIVAALRSEKNHGLFLRAASLTLRQRGDAHFVIVGDGPERQKLAASCQAAGLCDRVHFLGTRNDIPELLAAMNVFSLTSHIEANPVSILEAFACAVPVVATRVGSVPQTVRHGTTGFLVDPGDAEQLASYWVQLFNDPRLAQSLGETGQTLVAAKWSVERMVEGYQRLITEIYQRKVGGRNQ